LTSRRLIALTLGVLAILALPAGASAKTYDVTRTGDPAPNGCRPHDCSLREAVHRANNTTGADVLKLKTKTYELTIEGDASGTSGGDLDVINDLTIVGVKPSKTAIKGAWAVDPDRLLQVSGAGTKLSMSGLTLRDGDLGAAERGGAIAVDAGSALALSRVTVTKNRADNTGGIDNSGEATITKVRFTRNQASICCAAFNNEFGSRARLTDVTFDSNSSPGTGGAMFSDGTKATFRRVTFSRNISGQVGGALEADGGINDLRNVTFNGNQADSDGGALFVAGASTVELNNVTISGNTADADGGGTGDGGGLYNAFGSVDVRNSILAGNVDLGGEAPNCSQQTGTIPFVSGGHNLLGSLDECVDPSIKGSDRLNVGNPRLAPLAYNGGFTKTMALRRNSPALNHGSPRKPGTSENSCEKRDQRGVKRPQGPRCDIGAYERKVHH
jgi:predicted outer membrane repeat protein